MTTVDKAEATANPRSERGALAGVRRFARKHGWSYLFILPSLITFSLFTLIPVLWSFLISFQDFSLARGGTWMDPWYENYVDAFTQQRRVFLIAIQNICRLIPAPRALTNRSRLARPLSSTGRASTA